MTKIVYLIGRSGTGKYTIAKEFIKHGYIICDNQLINNPIFALLEYDNTKTIPDCSWDAIGKIRKIILEFLGNKKDGNYILTNELLDDEGDRNCYNQIKEMAAKRNSIFIPVKLNINFEENKKRIKNLSRLDRYKSIEIADNYFTTKLLDIYHPNLIEIDVSRMSAKEVTKMIIEFVNICK